MNILKTSCAMLAVAVLCFALASWAEANCPPDSSHASASAELVVGRISSGTIPWEDCLLIAADGTIRGKLQFLDKERGRLVEDHLEASQLRSLLAEFDRAHDQESAVNFGHSSFVFQVTRGMKRLQWTGMPQPTAVVQLQKTLAELLERLADNSSSDKLNRDSAR